MSSDNVLSFFSEEQASQLSGVPKNKLTYWHNTGFYKSQFSNDDWARGFTRAYSFYDIVCLRTLSILTNEHNVPLNRLRRTLSQLFQMDQSRWARETLYVLNRQVYFERPDGKLEQTESTQMPLTGIPLKQVIGEVRRSIKSMSKRPNESAGQIVKLKNVRNSKPVFKDSGVPVSTVKEYLASGRSTEDILRDFPSLTKVDIEAARAYAA
jgi:uncharacterized protein (DUF433 family)